MKKLNLLAAISVLALAVAGCAGEGGAGSSSTSESASGGTAELQTVTVGHVQLPIFAPLYVADARGYFKDAGIDIELVNIKSGQEAVPLAANGNLDVVAAGLSAGMFSAINTGLDIKVVGSMGVQPGEDEPTPSALVVSKELSTNYDSIENLRGKKIAVLGGKGGSSAYFVGLALEKARMTTNDVNLISLANPDMPSALANGSIDAAFMSAPFWQFAVENGAEKVWSLPEGISGTGILYGGKFADSNLSQTFFSALAKGAQDLQGKERNSPENLQIIAEYTGQTAEEVAAVPLYTWHPDLRPLPEQLLAMEQIWMTSDALNYSNAIPQENYIDARYAENVDTASN